jgi:hypothetical protein
LLKEQQGGNMPDLKLPLMSNDLLDGRQVLNHLWVHLFIVRGASDSDIQLVRDSVSTARRLLQKYDFGLSVMPAGGWDDKDQIGTFSFSGPLFIDGVDAHGRLDTGQQGAVQARGEVEPKITWKDKNIKPAVVLFGPSTSTKVRGVTNESERFPWFCSVGLTQAAKTTMLHEVGHCANLQHYMAQANLTDPTTKDVKNIMADVSDQQAEHRDRLSLQEINLLKGGYFYNRL